MTPENTIKLNDEIKNISKRDEAIDLLVMEILTLRRAIDLSLMREGLDASTRAKFFRDTDYALDVARRRGEAKP